MLTFFHGRPVFPRPLPGGSTAEAIFRGWPILAQTCQKCNKIDRVWYSILARCKPAFFVPRRLRGGTFKLPRRLRGGFRTPALGFEHHRRSPFDESMSQNLG